MWTQVPRKGKQFLLHYWFLSRYSSQLYDDKSWISKGWTCDCHKGKIYVVIYNIHIRNDLANHCGNHDFIINSLKEMSFKISYIIFVIPLNKCIRVLKQNIIPWSAWADISTRKIFVHIPVSVVCLCGSQVSVALYSLKSGSLQILRLSVHFDKFFAELNSLLVLDRPVTQK